MFGFPMNDSKLRDFENYKFGSNLLGEYNSIELNIVILKYPSLHLLLKVKISLMEGILLVWTKSALSTFDLNNTYLVIHLSLGYNNIYNRVCFVALVNLLLSLLGHLTREI